MYFPKSQIKTNLNTKGGEFIFKNSLEEYKGYYFETSTGEYYTGKHPNDFPVREIIALEAKNINDNLLTSPSNSILTAEEKPSIWSYDYLKSPLENTPTPTSPTQIYPAPQDKDYELGEFQRYFLSKTNEPKFIEVNKEQYQRYIDKDESVSYQLYEGITIPWDISGDRNQVYNTNKNVVSKAERDNKIPGFKSYFRERYDQFYK